MASRLRNCEIARIVEWPPSRPTREFIAVAAFGRQLRESDALRSPTPRQSSNLGIRFLVDAFARTTSCGCLSQMDTPLCRNALSIVNSPEEAKVSMLGDILLFSSEKSNRLVCLVCLGLAKSRPLAGMKKCWDSQRRIASVPASPATLRQRLWPSRFSHSFRPRNFAPHGYWAKVDLGCENRIAVLEFLRLSRGSYHNL